MHWFASIRRISGDVEMQEANLCINNVENKQEVINCSFFFFNYNVQKKQGNER